ncbi:hypothetical protein NLI96_g7590 [Meripilus lineatus]|uniref:Uncharacterized protein n=1 Tax=Meripilus lineatus TaxID=2056292 RepID=A0AAD5V3N6_9APHY|nr:hypothetical protein NLI96_g7590 [Physisporinus lineatus]
MEPSQDLGQENMLPRRTLAESHVPSLFPPSPIPSHLSSPDASLLAPSSNTDWLSLPVPPPPPPPPPPDVPHFAPNLLYYAPGPAGQHFR